jgi:hypothetical protein
MLPALDSLRDENGEDFEFYAKNGNQIKMYTETEFCRIEKKMRQF